MAIPGGTSEQKFMIMLKERIDALEDQVRELTTQLDNQKHANKSLFYYFSIEANENSIENVNSYIDEIFRNRHVYEPTFACWKHYKTNNDISVVMSLIKPISSMTMEALLKSDKYSIVDIIPIDFALFKWLFYNDENVDNVKEYHPDWESDFEPGYFNNDDTEYWSRYVCEMETDVEIDRFMTTQPFTQSWNYNNSPEVQDYLKRKVFVEHAWSVVLGLSDVFMD
jgi:hypothetical protein